MALGITLAEGRLHLKVDNTDDDDLITQLIEAATEYSEQFQHRTYLNRTRFLYLDCFPSVIVVLWPPLVSVTSLKYVDTDGNTQTLDSADYRVDINTEPGRITPAFNASWPDIRHVTSAITIEFIAGYGATSATTPEDVQASIKLLIGHWYENREGASELNIKEVPLAVETLLYAKRVIF